MNVKIWKDPVFRLRRLEQVSKQAKEFWRTGVFKHPDWTGKRHTEESKRAIGLANSVKQQGERNSQFGTVWIHNETELTSMRIPKEELNSYIELGWLKGRKMKW